MYFVLSGQKIDTSEPYCTLIHQKINKAFSWFDHRSGGTSTPATPPAHPSPAPSPVHLMTNRLAGRRTATAPSDTPSPAPGGPRLGDRR